MSYLYVGAVALLLLSPARSIAENVHDAAAKVGATDSAKERAGALDAETINGEAVVVLSAGGRVEEAFEAYARAKGIRYGTENANGQFYFQGSETISVDPTNAQWGKARVLAFERALLEAQTAFVRYSYGSQLAEIEKRFFQDASDGADEFPVTGDAGRLSALIDKALALTDAVLEKRLAELGVDPEEFRSKPAPQRKKLVEDTIRTTTLTRAMGDMAGMFPVQTFEGSDGKGTHTIGVVAMYSPKLRQLADDTRRGKTPLLASVPKKPLAEYVPNDPATLADQFGMRVFFDQRGEPCLVSYGQWSHNYTGTNERTRERRREAAKASALERADSYITLFQAGRLRLDSEKEVGDAIEEAILKDGDGNLSSDDITRIIDRTNERVRASGKADLIGRSQPA